MVVVLTKILLPTRNCNQVGRLGDVPGGQHWQDYDATQYQLIRIRENSSRWDYYGCKSLILSTQEMTNNFQLFIGLHTFWRTVGASLSPLFFRSIMRNMTLLQPKLFPFLSCLTMSRANFFHRWKFALDWISLKSNFAIVSLLNTPNAWTIF